jgi:hypothetical protein
MAGKRHLPVDIPGQHLAAEKTGGGYAQFEPCRAITSPGLEIGIGEVAGQGQAGIINLEARQARPIGLSRKSDGHAIALGGQFDRGLQPLCLHVTAFEGRRGHPGGQPHKLAAIDAGVTEDVGGAIVRIEPDAGALDEDQRTGTVGSRRTTGEALDQGIQ